MEVGIVIFAVGNSRESIMEYRNMIPVCCPYCRSQKISVRPLAVIFHDAVPEAKRYVCEDCKMEW